MKLALVVLLLVGLLWSPVSTQATKSARYEPTSLSSGQMVQVTHEPPARFVLHAGDVHVFDVVLLYFEVRDPTRDPHQVVGLNITVNWSRYVLMYNFSYIASETEYSVAIDQSHNPEFYDMAHNQTFYADRYNRRYMTITFVFTSSDFLDFELHWETHQIRAEYLKIDLGRDRKERYTIAGLMFPRDQIDRKVGYRTFYIVFPIIFMDWADSSLDGIRVKFKYSGNHSSWGVEALYSTMGFGACVDGDWMVCGYRRELTDLAVPVRFPEVMSPDLIQLSYEVPYVDIYGFSNPIMLVMGMLCAVISYKLTLLDGHKRRENQEMESNPRVFEYEMQRRYGGL